MGTTCKGSPGAVSAGPTRNQTPTSAITATASAAATYHAARLPRTAWATAEVASFAQYYIDREAYVAAINRAKYALEHYPGAPAIQDSLFILAQAYSLLGMPDLAADARRVFDMNFESEPPPVPESQVEVLELEVADAAEPPGGETDPEG